jgi:uncharacterized protein DUF3237
MHRRHFLDKELLYLFSYNAEIDPLRKNIGLVPEGVRFDVSGVPSESRVFHVLRERTETGLPPGAKVVTGRVRIGNDTALYRSDDVVVDDIRLTIETDDGEVIGSRYRGSGFLRMGGFEEFVAGIDKSGTNARPVQAPIVITPRYETSAPQYRWLMDYQCVGFGCIQLQYDFVRRVTYDIYAMT